MDYTFDDKYIAKSLIEMVRDEGKRIVASGLATRDEVNSFIGHLVSEASGYDDIGVFIDGVRDLHHCLDSVRLPGDFKKVAGDNETLEVPEETDAEDSSDDTFALAYNKHRDYILEKLASVVYEFGSNGNHEAAYLVERAINEISVLDEPKK
jgi:hypothetical protein